MKYPTDEASLIRDTKISFFRGSGPGGQNKNKVETGVRLYHVPSKTALKAQKERTQGENRRIAFERLKKFLEQLNKPKKRRKPTKVPASAKKERLKAKRAHSRKKEERERPSLE